MIVSGISPFFIAVIVVITCTLFILFLDHVLCFIYGDIHSFAHAVNAIAFGAVDTTMNAHLSVEEKKTLCEEIPAEKMAAPEEAAACISHILAMPDYMTGEILKFDGGWI